MGIIQKTLAKINEIFKCVDDLSTGCFHQPEANRKEITTVGTDTYLNNKVDVVLTADFTTGKLSLNTVDKRIEHTGEARTYFFNAIATIDEPSIPNMVVHFCLHKNGVIVAQAEAYTKLEALTGASGLNAASGVYMEDGDYLEVYCKTDKTNGAFYCNHMQLQLNENLASTLA